MNSLSIKKNYDLSPYEVNLVISWEIGAHAYFKAVGLKINQQ